MKGVIGKFMIIDLKFYCGHCRAKVTIEHHANLKHDDNEYFAARPTLLKCTACKRELVLYSGHGSNIVQPMPLSGEAVGHLPYEVNRAYTEARIAFSAGAHTACMLMCRNILAYAANESGSGKRHNYTDYIDYLREGNHINQTMKDWAEDIRRYGNDAAHDLKLRNAADADQILKITKYLLEFMYEVEGERRAYRKS